LVAALPVCASAVIVWEPSFTRALPPC